MASKSRAASGFLTPTNLRAIGRNLQRAYPVDQSHSFDGLLKALDDAARKTGRAR